MRPRLEATVPCRFGKRPPGWGFQAELWLKIQLQRAYALGQSFNFYLKMEWTYKVGGGLINRADESEILPITFR